MVKTKFLVLSEDPIKGYELIFKPSLKFYSWNLMIFEVFIVDLIGVSKWYWRPQHFYTKRCVLMRSITFTRKKRDFDRKIFKNHYFSWKKFDFFWWNLYVFTMKSYQDNFLPKFFLHQKIALEKLHLLVGERLKNKLGESIEFFTTKRRTITLFLKSFISLDFSWI